MESSITGHPGSFHRNFRCLMSLSISQCLSIKPTFHTREFVPEVSKVIIAIWQDWNKWHWFAQVLSWFEFQLKGNRWLFLAMKLQYSKLSEKLRVKSRSKKAQFQNKNKSRIILDYPWVETQVNSALWHMLISL